MFVTFCQTAAQQPVINEVMPANGSTLVDDEGVYSDWIEIFNPGETDINLQGYALSDNADKPDKWLFPAVLMKASTYLIVFASGKDQQLWVNQWETVVDRGDHWKYRPGTSEPPADWREVSFNDADWQAGPSGFGYGDDDDATIIDPMISIFLRIKVVIDNPAAIETAILHMDYDDGFVAYLNGTEIARANIGTPGIPPAFDQPAANSHEAGGIPEKFIVSDIKSILLPGENVLAIQAHNVGATSSDMTAIPFLTLGSVVDDPQEDLVSPYLALVPLALHTNFKLDNSGEILLLRAPEGAILDLLHLEKAALDISYGRYPDGADNWYYFEAPTPGYTNSSTGFLGIASPVLFSHDGGFYSGSFSVSLSHQQPAAEIKFTRDGSMPDEGSETYQDPISITGTTVLRARAYLDNMLPGEVVTNSYFIGETFTLPVISLATNPENFWDENTGIYAMGPNPGSEIPYFGANFWQDWERPVHIEYFEPEGILGFALDCGVKIYGAWSRAHPQKSLALYARSKYGFDEIAYPIFKDKAIDSFQSLVLRNSGNDWNYTMFRDALMTGLVAEEDIDIQAYQPAILFINGEYWGLHNIREKISEHFIAENHPVEASNLDLLENNRQVIHGDAWHYQEFLDFIETQDLSQDENFQQVQHFIEVDNFISYQAAQIYFDNKDWPGNNIKYWRPRSAGGRWRWILFDTDFGFSIYDGNAYTYNTLAFALDPNGPDWPNPPWSTFVLRKLLENKDFRNRFINRFADYFNSIFSPSAVNAKIEHMQAVLEPEMPRHFNRWGGSVAGWHSRIRTMQTFADERPGYLRDYIESEFNLNGTYRLTCNIDPPAGGEIRINTLTINQAAWQGTYFDRVPISVSAISLPGYRFAGWQGASSDTKAVITVISDKDITLRAQFVKDDRYQLPVVINEINYNSNKNYDSGDWLEVYNNSDAPIDLSGWSIADDGAANPYIFPDKTLLDADSYLVICQDQLAFSKIYSDAIDRIGDFTFNLANEGEYLQLADSRGEVVDSLTFDDKEPWPTAADGSGATLSLRHPAYDNALGENWRASGGLGTPGKRNDTYEPADIRDVAALPQSYQLQQNYPNPFNNATIINYQLPMTAKVELSIYNLRGQRIAMLFSGNKQAGSYQITWDASGFASGIYFYRLATDRGFCQTRKMILLR